MAITDTKQAKDFTAGAPKITLKGDLTPKKMASEPNIMDERNELSLRLFGKELKLLKEDEPNRLFIQLYNMNNRDVDLKGKEVKALGGPIKTTQ